MSPVWERRMLTLFPCSLQLVSQSDGRIQYSPCHIPRTFGFKVYWTPFCWLHHRLRVWSALPAYYMPIVLSDDLAFSSGIIVSLLVVVLNALRFADHQQINWPHTQSLFIHCCFPETAGCGHLPQKCKCENIGIWINFVILVKNLLAPKTNVFVITNEFASMSCLSTKLVYLR